MTADAKVGLLLGLVFIVMIAFLINGLPNFLQTANAKDAIDVSITVPTTEVLVIDERVGERARHFQQNDIPLRHSTPPQGVVVLDEPTNSIAQEPDRRQTPVHIPDVPVIPSSPQPVRSAMKTHVVSSGDNLAVIAQKYYGKDQGNRRVVIQKLFEANKSVLKSPDKVCLGQKLTIPSLDVLMNDKVQAVANTPQPQPSTPSFMQRVSDLFERSDRESAVAVHVVQNGESLWGIAQATLGDGKRYKEILKLNQAIKDADDVVVGMHLKLPTN